VTIAKQTGGSAVRQKRVGVSAHLINVRDRQSVEMLAYDACRTGIHAYFQQDALDQPT